MSKILLETLKLRQKILAFRWHESENIDAFYLKN